MMQYFPYIYRIGQVNIAAISIQYSNKIELH